jgi:hypothetical protein
MLQTSQCFIALLCILPPLIIKFGSNFLSNPQGKNLYTIKEWLIIIMMAKGKQEQQGLIQEKIEDLLRDNPSRSYSKEEHTISFGFIIHP